MTTQAHEQWLAGLKPGDQVAIQAGMSGNYTLYTVAERTKQHVILSTGAKYRVTSGRAVNAGKWDTNSIEEVTPDLLKKIKRRKLENAVWSELVKLDINVVRKLSNERLEELLKVLRKEREG